MRDYFKRLKNHAGLDTATFMTIMGTLAGASNKTFPEIWQGALFGLIVVGSIVWTIVLISNFKNVK